QPLVVCLQSCIVDLVVTDPTAQQSPVLDARPPGVVDRVVLDQGVRRRRHRGCQASGNGRRVATRIVGVVDDVPENAVVLAKEGYAVCRTVGDDAVLEDVVAPVEDDAGVGDPGAPGVTDDGVVVDVLGVQVGQDQTAGAGVCVDRRPENTDPRQSDVAGATEVEGILARF